VTGKVTITLTVTLLKVGYTQVERKKCSFNTVDRPQ